MPGARSAGNGHQAQSARPGVPRSCAGRRAGGPRGAGRAQQRSGLKLCRPRRAPTCARVPCCPLAPAEPAGRLAGPVAVGVPARHWRAHAGGGERSAGQGGAGLCQQARVCGLLRDMCSLRARGCLMLCTAAPCRSWTQGTWFAGQPAPCAGASRPACTWGGVGGRDCCPAQHLCNNAQSPTGPPHAARIWRGGLGERQPGPGAALSSSSRRWASLAGGSAGWQHLPGTRLNLLCACCDVAEPQTRTCLALQAEAGRGQLRDRRVTSWRIWTSGEDRKTVGLTGWA